MRDEDSEAAGDMVTVTGTEPPCFGTEAFAIERSGTVDPGWTIVIVAVPPPAKVASLEVNATVNARGVVADGLALTGMVIGVGFAPFDPAGQVTVPDDAV